MNTYVYVESNPISFIDPMGLWPTGMPGKSDTLENTPGWIQTYLPDVSDADAKAATATAVENLGWGDVKNGIAIFGINPTPPDPKDINKLPQKQKDFIKAILEKLKISEVIRKKVAEKLDAPCTDKSGDKK